MITEAIEKLMQAENLTYDQVKESVDEIMTGQASPALIASFLTALSIKGETDEEIAGAAESMRSKALPLDGDGDSLDSVGQQRDDGACPAGGEHLLHVRPKVPQRHEICGAGTPGTGHSHHF